MTDCGWITFTINLQKLPWYTWTKLGQCVAKCEQVKTVPLQPRIRDRLHLIYLAKGVHATTAIEGNTLTEQQVVELLENGLKLPPSKEYLEQEVNNILDVADEIAGHVSQGTFRDITVEKICYYNEKVLQKDVPCDEAAVPGEIRNHNVLVGRAYRPPNAESVPALMERFCDWMNSGDFVNEQMPVHFAIIKAIVAHLYMAWIHPFGDGNGRVARLLEFAILLNSAVPSPAAHLLSNHYNMTRAEYYRQLDRASKTADPTGFFSYAIQGFLDGLEEQLTHINQQVVDVCWRDYIYEEFRRAGHSATTRRRRELALQISTAPEPLDKNALLLLLRDSYKDKSERTLVRDLGDLEKRHLVTKSNNRYSANKDLVLRFRPFSAPLQEQK